MHHPQVNPTLTPYDYLSRFRLQRARQKLVYAGRKGINGEHEILNIWSRQNRLTNPKPLPAEEIIHFVLPGLARNGHTKEPGDFLFDGKPYLERDIFVLTNTISWLGTNVGSTILSTPPRRRHVTQNRYVARYAEMEEGWSVSPDLASFLVHDWCENCNKGLHCKCNKKDASTRDRLVIQALMYWLGGKRGGAFITEYTNRIVRLHDGYKWKKYAI